jgi:glutamine amidotransferase-like uncharacterized protein
MTGAPGPPAGPVRRGLSRRDLLLRLAPLGALGLAAACSGTTPPSVAHPDDQDRPLALLYRGPAACRGCAEAVAALLESSSTRYRIDYCGPDERLELTASTLAGASLYVQPGGGDDLDAAWRAMHPFAPTLRRWIHGGGRYVGFCMGGFLAGSDPGFGILPGDSGEYITTPGATVQNDDDALVTVRWGDTDRSIYFQGGPYFTAPTPGATVLGTYTNGRVAALVAPYGSGRVGVTGPHPEAPVAWYRQADLSIPDPLPFDLGHQLVETTMAH